MKESILSEGKWRASAGIQTWCNRRKMRSTNNHTKVFCVGLNKTGTTSWAQAMSDLGYVVGSETTSTMLFYDWVHRKFDRIIDYCRTDGQAFQDFPFSLPDTYKKLDQAFPGSRFVLTIRDSAEQWYDSLIKFHGKHWSLSGKIPPTPGDLSVAVYWRKGLLADYCREVFKTPTSDPYHRETLLSFYRRYNLEIEEYFVGRDKNFLVLNVSLPGAYNRLRKFLGFSEGGESFPWKNKT